MKVAIVIMPTGQKQIIFNPETEAESQVLDWIEDGEVEIEHHVSTFSDDHCKRFGVEIKQSNAGMLRAYQVGDKSLMLKLTPKEKK